jgi:phenylpropionate dioxygenase-like ring-hydroxylating dioxygenase large terminal subunit
MPRRRVNPIPHEGEGGLYFQTWYPLCLSTDVPKGGLLGVDFLDGRVVVYRTSDGAPNVVSAYCPHLGADLSVGSVEGDNLRCAFHHWEYNVSGECVKTGIGDPAPKAACLFRFPVAEHFGVIWAFNGTEALWDLPDFERPDDQLVFRTLKVPTPYACDGWVFCCNTPDMQHIKVVHQINFEHDDPHEMINWQDWGFDYRIKAAHQGGVSIDWQIGIRGTSLFRQQGMFNDWWLGGITGHSCPRPGMHEVFLCLAVEKGEHAQDRLDTAQSLLERTVSEDQAILNTIHYKPGTLTRGDKTLGRFFDYLRKYPRAHPSADFIV